ncbi:MAG TPA: protease inhibitor I42 family protein [Phycisphaerae bacterium]|nr:protease inhibitor I42 family protein [Phycisphaerae bacterium]
MKTMASILIGCACLAGIAAPAAGELCTKCKRLSYTADVGKCVVCGGPTASGAFKLCKACSAKLGQCEHCRASLAQGSPAAGEVPIDGPIPSKAAPPPRPLVPGGPTAGRIDREKSGTYTSGHWTFVYEIHAKGSRGEWSRGKLLYWTRPLEFPKGRNDHYDTPWGKLYYTGVASAPFGRMGWSPLPPTGGGEGKLLPAPDPGKIAPKQSDTYKWGKWKYVYKVAQAGTRMEGYHGALLYDGKAVPTPQPPGGPTNDYYETPWGRVYWTGQPNMIQGPHEWMPGPRPRSRMGKQLPDPGQPGPAGDAAFQSVVLRDVQGLSGGQDLWLFADGRLIVQVVRFGDRTRPCSRYATRLDANALAKVGRLLTERKFFKIKTRDRAGVPDEAHPAITVRSAEGKEHTVRKWANDKHPDFDAIYEELLGLVKSACRGQPEYAGAYDRAWAPKPADPQPAGGVNTLVPGRMVCCQACKAKLDLANGIKKCPGCAGICNVAHKMCTKCAVKAGVCEVCGKAMAGPAAQVEDLVIEEAFDGKTVTAVVGQKIIIRIASRGAGPTPPPKWTAKLKGDSLTQEGEIRLRARRIAGPTGSGIVGIQQGGPMTLEATFRAAKPGKTTVTLEARPWRQADAAAEKTFTVTVDVQAKAGQPTPQASETLKLTEGHDGKTVVAKGVSKVLIELPSAPPPGVEWKVAKIDGDSLKQIGGLQFGGLQPVGGPGGIFVSSRGTGLARLTFGVVALGKTTISLEYRAKGPGRPIRTYSVTVDVQALPPGQSAKPSDAQPAKPLVVTQDSSGKTVTLTTGQKLIIRLKANPSTGYSWTGPTIGGKAVMQEGRVRLSQDPAAAGRLGAGGAAELTLKAISPGKATVKLEYRRPWEKDKPAARTFSLTVEVKGSAKAVEAGAIFPQIQPVFTGASLRFIEAYCRQRGIGRLGADRVRLFRQPMGIVGEAIEVDLANRQLTVHPATHSNKEIVLTKLDEGQAAKVKALVTSDEFGKIPEKNKKIGLDGTSYLVEARIGNAYSWKLHWSPDDKELRKVIDHLRALAGAQPTRWPPSS